MTVRRWLQKPRRILAGAGVYVVLGLFRLLPGPVLIRLSRLLGLAAYHLLSTHRKRALDSLGRVYADSKSSREQARLARACFMHFGELAGEHLYLRRGERVWRKIRVEIIGTEHVERVLERGRGAIYVGAHLGNWELGACHVCRSWLPLTAIALEVEGNPLLQRLLDGHRRRLGLSVQYARTSGAFESLRVLRRNEVLVMLSDLRTRGRGVMAPFLGIPAHTQTGAALLAGRSGAGLLTAYAYRAGFLEHRIVIEEPIPLHPPEAGPKDTEAWNAYLAETTKRINDRLSAAILAHPDQWMWMHRRFEKPSQRHGYTVIE